jgi:hypothetical protein
MGSWFYSWGNKEEQLPQKEIMCEKSITATSDILDTRSNTDAEVQAGEFDIGILGKIEEDRKNTGEDAHLQPEKNATDPTFPKSTLLSKDLLVKESQTAQEKLMLDRHDEFTRSTR